MRTDRRPTLASLILTAAVAGCGGNREPIRDLPDLEGRDRNAAGLLLHAQGRPYEAELAFRDAYRASWAIDDVDGRADALYNLARVHLEEGRPRDASEELAAAEEIYRARGRDDGLARVLAARALVLRNEGDAQGAVALATEALTIAPDAVRPEILVMLARLELARGRAGVSEEHAREAVEESADETTAGDAVRSDALHALGRSLSTQERWDEAERAYLECLDLDRWLDRRPALADTLMRLAEVATRAGRTAEADRYLLRAEGVLAALGRTDEAAAARARVEGPTPELPPLRPEPAGGRGPEADPQIDPDTDPQIDPEA